MDDNDRRERLTTLISNISQQVAEAESLAVDQGGGQPTLAASNELAQLRQLLTDLELKIRTDQSRERMQASDTEMRLMKDQVQSALKKLGEQ
jgi:hypothetical protein